MGIPSPGMRRNSSHPNVIGVIMEKGGGASTVLPSRVTVLYGLDGNGLENVGSPKIPSLQSLFSTAQQGPLFLFEFLFGQGTFVQQVLEHGYLSIFVFVLGLP